MRGVAKSAAVAALALTAVSAHAADKFAGYHTFAVVSLIPNHIVLATEGPTRFDLGSRTTPTDWDVQAAIAQRAIAALQGHYDARSVTLPMDVFDKVDAGWWGHYWDHVGERVKDLPKIEGVDAYIIAFPWFGLNRDDPARGLFIYHDAGWFAGKGTVVSVPYGIEIFDAKTGKNIAAGRGRFPWGDTFSGYGDATEECADDLWSGEGDLSDAGKERLQTEVFSLLDRSVPFALYDAGLISEDEAKATLPSARPGDPSCHVL